MSISNERPNVFDMKIAPTIEGFVYDDVLMMHTDRHDFASGAKIKSQDLMLKPRLLHKIITLILPKKRHFDKVTFMDLCLIDCLIKRRPINFSYIMMKNLIMENNQK